MATLCRTEFLASEDLVVWFIVPLQQVVDSGTGRITFEPPVGIQVFAAYKPDNTSYSVSPVAAGYTGFYSVTIPAADYVQGYWKFLFTQEDGAPPPLSEPQTIVASWGVTNTATVAANDARTQATISAKMLTAEVVPNSDTAPTSVEYKISGTTYKTRTIANASAVPVSPDQLLTLGEAT